MARIKGYNVKTADWRKILRKNEARTRFVIALYIVIYLCVGLLFDLYLSPAYDSFGHYIPLSQSFINLVTFAKFPIATFIAVGVAAISLLITFMLNNKLMLLGTEYIEVKPGESSSLEEQQLYNVVYEMKLAAGLSLMPKIYIIEANYMNAFASGFSEKSAMVAITRGLMSKLDRSELQAVMAHELTHIRHKDIKLTLMASVLSNLILIVIDILFYSMIFSGRRSSSRQGDGRLFAVIMILRFVLPIITILLMMYLSRTREFMADAGSVELMRENEPMARALLKIHRDHMKNSGRYQHDYNSTAHEEVRRAAYLYDPRYAGLNSGHALSSLFTTHPPLNERLQALGIKKEDV